MPVGVGIVAESDVEAVLELYQARHGEGARAIHSDPAVMVHGHERKCRIEIRIHDRDIETEALGNRLPVTQGSAAQRVNANFYASGTDGLEIDNVRQVLHIRHDKIFRVGCCGFESGIEIDAADVFIPGAQQFVGAVLNRVRDVRIRWSSVWQVVFEAAISRWIVRRCDDDAIGDALRAILIVFKDGAGDHRRRGKAVIALNEGFDFVCREHFEGHAFGGAG